MTNSLRTLLYLILAAVPASFASADDLFVAAGYGGRRMVSTDGENWTIADEWAQPGGDDGNNLMSAAWAEGKFVVVGGGGGGRSGNGHVLVSVDGREWKQVYKTHNRVNPVVYGGGRFVAGAPDRSLIVSDDGETWTAGATIDAKEATHFRHGAYGNGRFVFVGNGGGGGALHWAAVSEDGSSMRGVRTDLPGHGKIVFHAGQFSMLTSHSQADVLSSADGLEWTRVAIDGDRKFEWIVSTGDAILLGDRDGILRSTDGAGWTRIAPASRGEVLWSDGTRFVATGWPGKMFFSPDGQTWRNSPPLTENGINVIVRKGD